MRIEPWHPRYLHAAAALAAGKCAALKRRVPALPDGFCREDRLAPLIAGIAGSGPMAVAVDRGRLVGFMGARVLPELRGQRTSYSPEWANAVGANAIGANPAAPATSVDAGLGRIWQMLYSRLAGAWVADGIYDHYLTMLAGDEGGRQECHRLGFGDVVTDWLRPLPFEGSWQAPAEIRQAGPADLAAARDLHGGLLRHLAAAPIFLVDAARSTPEEIDAWLADSGHALFLAYRDGEAVASLGIQGANSDACTIIRDPGTASIVSAFTRPEARGSGIGTALLAHALAWAQANGYVRCAVDCETANIHAMRFWSRHFTPICHSLGRRVNPMISARRID